MLLTLALVALAETPLGLHFTKDSVALKPEVTVFNLSVSSQTCSSFWETIVLPLSGKERTVPVFDMGSQNLQNKLEEETYSNV